jgi:hypothetical protein
MSRTSVISHPASTPLVIVRREYLDICDGSHAAAALLNHFEYLTNVRRAAECDVWIRRGFRQLADELLGLYGEKSISDAVSLLLDKGFIERRHNPDDKTDRTYQYRLCVDRVQDAVDAWADDDGFGGHSTDASLCETQKSETRGRKNAECLIRENLERKDYAPDGATSQMQDGDENAVPDDAKTGDDDCDATHAQRLGCDATGDDDDAKTGDASAKKPRSRRKVKNETPAPPSDWMTAFREVWPDLAPARAGSIIAMITGRARRGEWRRCRLEQPLDTPEELRAFGAFMRRRMKDLKLASTIRSAEVIQQWVFDFRAEQRRQAEEREKYAAIPGYIPLSQCRTIRDFERRHAALQEWARRADERTREIVVRQYEQERVQRGATSVVF